MHEAEIRPGRVEAAERREVSKIFPLVTVFPLSESSCRRAEYNRFERAKAAKADRLRQRRERAESERRKAIKESLKERAESAAKEEAMRANHLQSELAIMAGRRREKALQDHIRVNILKVKLNIEDM